MVCKYSFGIKQIRVYSIVLTCFLLCCYLKTCNCLYEDQVGKFDWKQNLIGKVKYANFDAAPGGKRLFVASEENVVAAINIKTGNIIWRQVLEEGDQGRIHFLTVDSDVITISGDDVYYIRGWDPTGGFLLWEWTLPVTYSENFGWHLTKDVLYRIHLAPETHVIEITSYDMFSGSQISAFSHPAPWLQPTEQCAVAGLSVVCVVDSKVHWFSWENNSEPVHVEVPLSELVTDTSGVSLSKLSVLSTSPATVLLGDRLLSFISNNIKVFPSEVKSENLCIVPWMDKHFVLQAVPSKEVLEITARYLETGELETELSSSVKLTPSQIIAASCLSRKDREVACRLFLSSEDYTASLLLVPGKVLWTREEALAYIVSVEMLDLPVSDTDFAIEQEFQHKETGFFGMFFHRISSQVLQLRSFLLTLCGVKEAESERQRAGLVRDEFGLHKIVVTVSSNGKLFGVDNLSGKVLWSRWLPELLPYVNSVTNKVYVPFFVQRTARHSQYPAQCVLLFKHKESGKNVLFVFNPHNGQPADGEDGFIKLSYNVKQTMLLPHTDSRYLRGLLLLDEDNNFHVYPENAEHVAIARSHNTFVFTATPDDGHLIGYTLGYSTQEKLGASRTWEIQLGGKIIAVVGKSPIEKVHSQGRVLGDRSVLYKYINPNLYVILTQATDPVHKYLLNVYLVDVVSGSVVYSLTHKRAKDPVHVVHSENWVLYSYFSDKFRRTEMVALELYEGKTQSNTTAFSSVLSTIQPMVDRQAYILPASVRTMRETITEKGITSKHILVALSSGAVLELPWAFVDPRRPVTVTQEMREEGVIPYLPELPVPSDAIINYNQTLLRVKGIHTSPSGLESTCLVFVYGLDIFCTRVSPSKTFDLLKEDFEYPLIAAVLLALAVAAYITKKLSSKKALKQAWR